MDSKFRRSGFGISAWLLTAALISAPAFATPEEDYPGTNAVTTEVEPYHPVKPDLVAGFDLEFSPISYGNYVWKDGHTDPKSGYGVHLAVEWLPFADRIGKLGLGVGVGLYDISKIRIEGGYGELKALPLEPYLSYRLDLMRHQMLVPFVKVGPEVTILRDTSMPGNQTYYGINYTAGIELCLDRIDKSAARSLERDFGIRHSYLIAEFVSDHYLGKDQGPDLTRNEYRAGFRFEL